MLTVLDLFSGIGGFSLGLERTGGFRTVAFCEVDDYCRRVLAKHWPEVPIHGDVRELDGREFRGVDVVCGGFPCQPWSLAARGRTKAFDDPRHLWPEMHRIIGECRPRWVLAENVDGLVRLALDHVAADLEALGYTVGTTVIPAGAVGAPHRRSRVWITAHAAGVGRDGWAEADGRQARSLATGHPGRYVATAHANGQGQHDVAIDAEVAGASDAPNACRQGLPQREGERGDALSQFKASVGGDWPRDGWWPTEPPVCGADDGLPHRVDRLRALGNAVVPQVVEIIGHAILAVEKRSAT